MIDPELRFKGRLQSLMLNVASDAVYLTRQRLSNRMIDRLFKGKPVKGLQSTQEWIARPDGSQLRLCIYKPLTPRQDVPGVLWNHGGGYAIGVPELGGEMYKRLIEESGCVIVAPDYRLSTEAPYPAALDDCYLALLWMRDHAAELGIRANQLMVGGESAGGTDALCAGSG